jgi:ABC-type lipoprotein export system ATPase subunit/GNAT superfamily N-acetyltransferase
MRCRQIAALFDVPSQEKQTLRWSGEVPLDERPWNVGLIVGPSGCGKTTTARALFGTDALHAGLAWSEGAVLDDFPAGMPLEAITALCQAVGFNTIPAWLRPFSVLSNGEQFRVALARLLAESPGLVVLDEFTSVVDRQVARVGSHAVQKYIRQRGARFVAVSCHSDIIEWLNPDWILEPATMTFGWRSLQRRPTLDVEIGRVDYAAWRLFAPYHYLSADLHRAAACYVAFLDGRPVSLSALLYRPNAVARNIWGCSRLVTLPDYQGLGIAAAMQNTLGAAFKALGQRMHLYPAHPGLVRGIDRSPTWTLERKPGLIARNTASPSSTTGRMGGRPNAVFSYCGPAMADQAAARRLLDIPSLSRTT